MNSPDDETLPYRSPENDADSACGEELMRMGHDFKEMLTQLEPYVEQELRALSGSHFDSMMRSRSATLAHLTDSDSKLREAAIQIAYQYWKISNGDARIFEVLAKSDPEVNVRDAALAALGTCYRKTKDRRVGSLLALTCRDCAAPEGLRITAFASLLRLHGILDYRGPSPPVPVAINQIDWAFVDSYMVE